MAQQPHVGVIRNIDSKSRINVKPLMEVLGWKQGVKVNAYVEGDTIVIRKEGR